MIQRQTIVVGLILIALFGMGFAPVASAAKHVTPAECTGSFFIEDIVNCVGEETQDVVYALQNGGVEGLCEIRSAGQNAGDCPYDALRLNCIDNLHTCVIGTAGSGQGMIWGVVGIVEGFCGDLDENCVGLAFFLVDIVTGVVDMVQYTAWGAGPGCAVTDFVDDVLEAGGAIAGDVTDEAVVIASAVQNILLDGEERGHLAAGVGLVVAGAYCATYEVSGLDPLGGGDDPPECW